MFTLLAVLIAFVGTMLVLALAAQSIQELLKVSLALKGHARLQALRGLLVESARAAGQPESVGLGILASVQARLRNLGQGGFRSRSVRLDHLTPADLAGLILKAEAGHIAALAGLDQAERGRTLEAIASQATVWYDLALTPVDDRYRRQMRVWSLLSSAIVVLGLNADALAIFEQTRTDPAFRARMDTVTQVLDSLRREEQQVAGALAAAGAGTDTVALRSALAVIAARRDSVARTTAFTGTFLTGELGRRRWTDVTWWVGILASVLLVSLGTPFWHDVLEAMFGIKNRIRAQADAEGTRSGDQATRGLPAAERAKGGA